MFLGKDDGDDKYFCNSEDFEWTVQGLLYNLPKSKDWKSVHKYGNQTIQT